VRLPLPHSIRWRLQAWYALLIGGLLLSFGFAAYHIEAVTARDRFDDELSRLALDLSSSSRRPEPVREASSQRDGAGPSATPPGGDQPPAARPPRPPREKKSGKLGRVPNLADREIARGFYFAVWLHNGVPFTPSANAPADLPSPPPRQLGAHTRTRGLLREAYHSADYGDIALVGRSFAEEQAKLNSFAWRLSLGGAAILAAAVIIGWWLVTRALRPIQDISAAAAKIAVGNLSQRINSRDTDSELDQLVDVLNTTFARLDASFTREQRFTADAAHELRTPVTVIVTHVQNSLAAGGLTDEHREAWEACERAAQRMRRLIESLLQLARLDAGEEGGKHEPTELAALAAESVRSIRTLAAARKITLVTELATAEIAGDPGRLQQVITNLVTNAIYHGRDGGEVRISVRPEAGHAILTVADNGPGIAPEHAPHLFERFYRVDKARTSTAGRTGLGLAIVKAIIDAHGGTITVESRVGEGATFTVRLPRG
jgi:two-component system OmpR family sensor kinase